MESMRLFSGKAISYVDTLRVYLRNGLTREEQKNLGKYCGKLINYFDHPGGGVTYSIQQPTVKCLRILDRIFRRKRDYVNLVHIALDIAMKDWEALEASEFFRKHFVQSYSRYQPCMNHNTYYSKPRKWRMTNVAAYIPPKVKVIEGTCFHIEWRFPSSSNCRPIGITRPSHLLNFDAHEFWRKRWTFQRFDYADIERATHCLVDKNRGPFSRLHPMLCCTSIIDDEGTLSSGAFRASCLKFKLHPELYLRSMDVPFPHSIDWLAVGK